jgi:hypothetical protein
MLQLSSGAACGMPVVAVGGCEKITSGRRFVPGASDADDTLNRPDRSVDEEPGVKRTYLLPAAVALGLALTGCGQSVTANSTANTTAQSETGNGITMVAGDIEVESVTIVAGDEGSGRGAVSAVVVNGSDQLEALESITVDGVEATLLPATVPIEPGTSVPIATNSTVRAEVDFDAEAGQFVEVAFLFSESGVARDQVLIVPPIGYYEDFAPPGTRPAVDDVEASVGGENQTAVEEPAVEEPAVEEPAVEE